MREQGLTIVELLIALVIAGFIMSMVVRVMDNVIGNHEGLVSRTDANIETLRLRRLLHRDLAGMQGKTLRVQDNGFSLKTSHNLLSDTPQVVDVEWEAEGGSLLRREFVKSMGYTKEIVLVTGIRSFSMRILDSGGQRWMELRSWLLSRKNVVPEAMHFEFETETMSADILERVPILADMRLP